MAGCPAIGTPVAFEAAYGWGWLAEPLEDYGYQPHLVHPLHGADHTGQTPNGCM
ncbi:hypothetical protein ACIHEJ_34865 [Streptomyces sp. NPDC052301]|uniref:hypothetical protein n=1 Tax=Streptomyces sp. NPDC052301 TaxID=3365687 RepID=UPI0037D957D8